MQQDDFQSHHTGVSVGLPRKDNEVSRPQHLWVYLICQLFESLELRIATKLPKCDVEWAMYLWLSSPVLADIVKTLGRRKLHLA